MGARYLILALVLLAAGCRGPKPEVLGVELKTPSSADGPYRVHVTVANRGHGEGEISVVVRLKEMTAGTTLQKSVKARLRPGEQTRLTVEFDVPAGAWEPDVEAEYPPA